MKDSARKTLFDLKGELCHRPTAETCLEVSYMGGEKPALCPPCRAIAALAQSPAPSREGDALIAKMAKGWEFVAGCFEQGGWHQFSYNDFKEYCEAQKQFAALTPTQETAEGE